ncbi:MAG: cellulase family glycosylhydrolase [Chitinophagales bacterium]|nr:cellulase family glycosylhydrolase [Chitinophagales bacterium]
MKSLIYFLIISFFIISCEKESNYSNSISENKLLHATKGSNAGIYDIDNNYIILKGVNYNVLGDYWYANPNIPATKVYDKKDFELMARYGFNCVRLLFSWSKLEPVQGQYNIEYVQEIQQAIEDAAAYGIYVLLDMHQDAYGKYIATPINEICEKPNNGWDGAPLWATFTDSASTCRVGGRETAPAVVHAWQNFWDNTNQIQDACIKAWQFLVERTAQYNNVVGYDLLNEPSLGYKPLNQEFAKLSKYYGNLVKAIRQSEQNSGGLEHIIFFEMTVTWNAQEIPFIPDFNFTSDQNIIFAPHLYFEAISNLLTIEQGFELVHTLSKLYNTNMFIGEWGFFGDTAIDVEKIKRFMVKEDEYFVGSTWWQWAQAPGDPHAISWDGNSYANKSLHLIELDDQGNFTGNLNTTYLNVLSKARPIAIAGKPIKLVSNSDDGSLYFKATTNSIGTTTLWIPERFGMPVISGTNATLNNLKTVDGGYIASVDVNSTYEINISY